MSDLSWVPEACTLPTAEQVPRAEEFRELFVRERPVPARPSPGLLRLAFGAAAEAAVRDLIARESACCAFFDFTVTVRDGGVVLDIAVPAAYEPVLDALAAQIPG